jgi:outer membrane protein insertion porin family
VNPARLIVVGTLGGSRTPRHGLLRAKPALAHAILLGLLVASPAAAQADDPAAKAPIPAEEPPSLDLPEIEAPDVRAPGEGKPQAPAARIPIAGYEMVGPRIDPDDKLMELLVSVAPIGEPFVESGPSDRIGKPIGTIPRLIETLDGVGYRAAITKRPTGGGVTLVVDLLPADRVRYVFVNGNWPIRQDEIQRRITIRPGRPLPPGGAERTAALEQERMRVLDFLRSEGYFEASVRLDARSGEKNPRAVDLYVTIEKGPSYPLGPITFTGNRALPTEEIDKIFRHAAWYQLWLRPVPFTQKQLRLDIEALEKRYRELGYFGARVTTDFSMQKSLDRVAKNVRLAININERKKIGVAFEGNKETSSSTLSDELTLLSRGSYDDFEVASSADAIQSYYQANGYFFARVDWRRERLSADEERVVFMIDEGPQLRVRGIEFAGNKALPAKELEEVVTVRKYPPLGLGSGGYVTGKQMEQDVERILEHYRSKGFLEVKARAEAATSPAALGQIGAVAAGAETVSREAKTIFVRFTVEEGPRLVLASEDFRTAEGEPLPYGKQFLLESVTTRPGDAYTPQAVHDDGKRLERLLGDAGYPASSVDPDVNRSGDKVSLTWVLKLGRRVRIGPIFVRGNFKTTPETILEQIPLRSGDYLTTTAIERGQRNLGSLQLFNNATPITFPGTEERREVVPMAVEVEERYEQYSVLHLGLGASTEQAPPGGTSIPLTDWSVPIGFFLRGGYENRNFWGHGWNTAANLTYGTALLRGDLTFLDRRFFGTLFRFDIALNYLQQETVRLGDIRSGAGSIGFSREMYPGVDAGIHYNLRNTTHTEPLIRLAGPDETIGSVRFGTTVGSLSANIEWLRMDNRLVPTRGFRINALAELALPVLSAPLRPFPLDVGDDTFLKLSVRSLSVIPIGRFLFLRVGFRFEQGIPLGGESLLPKVERYFAGGDTTIRGYQLDRARVELLQYLDPSLGSGNVYRIDFRPLGGNLRILQNIDLLFPISPPWYGSVFIDNGVVADSLDGLSARAFRHGVGVSPLLVRLPIGDVSLAWGWPLDPGPGDTKIGVFHVNVGLLF